MDEKLKIAIIRGRNLNKWEMQNYEKIKFEFDDPIKIDNGIRQNKIRKY